MRAIGYTPPTRYDRLPYRERIMREFKRRLESKDWEFSTVNWTTILRCPLTDHWGDHAAGGERLSLIDSDETFAVNTSASENTFSVEVEYIINPGEDEVGISALNIVCAELIEVLCGQHDLREGGTPEGAQLTCSVYPVSYSPTHPDKRNPRARATLNLEVRYRTRTHKLFDQKP